MPDRKYVCEFMTGRFYSPILHLLGNLTSKSSLLILRKVWMVPSITLDANSPALLCHSEHKGPPLLGIQIGVGQNKKTLILSKLDILLQVFKYLTSMELLHLGVTPDASLNDTLLF